ncbi:hypothetical protein D3C80_1269990 [compost metagenome]
MMSDICLAQVAVAVTPDALAVFVLTVKKEAVLLHLLMEFLKEIILILTMLLTSLATNLAETIPFLITSKVRV